VRKIIVIGTLHGGITSGSELQKVLEEYNPDQLLVEIAQEDLDSNQLSSYPSEMIFASNWAKEKGIRLNGFDSKINVLKEGMTEADNQRVIEEQKALMGKLSWKDMNKASNYEKIETESAKALVDWEKEAERESEMARNAANSMIETGTVVILTGCGNLGLFRKQFKNAIFPYS